MSLMTIVFLCGQQGSVYSDFVASLSNPVYSNKKWISASVVGSPAELTDSYNSQRLYWRGRKYDRSGLTPYAKGFEEGKSYLDVRTYAIAYLGFNGSLTDDPAYTILLDQKSKRESLKVYWGLAKLWPKNPSWIDFRIRTQCYALCGAVNSNLLTAIRRYLSKYPDDPVFQRGELSCNLTVSRIWGPKMTVPELRKQHQRAKVLADKNLGIAYVGVLAMYAGDLAFATKERKFIEEYLLLSQKQIEGMKLNAIDKKGIPPLEAKMARVRALKS